MSKAELWNIVVQALTALGTLILAVLAIWGDWIRHRFLPPKLSVHLLDSEGSLTRITDGTPGRYYKLTVSNSRRWTPSKNARVILTKIFKPAADGELMSKVFSGPLQLTWQWMLPQYPTIGHDEICTFGHLIKGQNFALSTYIKPNNFVGFLEPRERMVIEVLAVGDNAESQPLYIDVAWDGKWSDDSKQMQQHLVVKEATQI